MSLVQRFPKHSKEAEETDGDKYILLERRDVEPNPKTELVAYTALKHPDIVLHFFKSKSDSTCFSTQGSCQSDLEMLPDRPFESSISVALDQKSVLLNIRSVHTAISHSKGTLTSIPDLANARMSLELRYGDNDDKWIVETLQGARILKLIAFRVGPYQIPFNIAKDGPSYVLNVDFPDSNQILQEAVSQPDKKPH